MKLKTDDPFVPEDIRAKINGLQSLLDHAADLYSDIYSWYDSELKSYDPKATADDELFDPGTGTVVEGIDYLSFMESLSELQTANECYMLRDLPWVPSAWPLAMSSRFRALMAPWTEVSLPYLCCLTQARISASVFIFSFNFTCTVL